MKTKILLVLCAMAMTFMSFTSNDPKDKSATVIYDGYEYDEYSFRITGDEEDEDSYLYFSNISMEILKSHDLQSDQLIGQRFKITYQVVPESETEEGDFTEETYILKTIKKI